MLNKSSFTQFAISAFVLFNISACGGDSEDPQSPVVVEVPPQVNQAKVFNGPLNQTNASQAQQFIKNGIYANSIAAVNADDAVSSPALGNESSGASSNRFSQTNTVEQGVDESDRLKYDGTHMYVAQTSTYYLSEPVQPNVRVLKRNDDFTLTALPSISSSLAFERIDGIYLHNNTLAMLGASINYYPIDIVSIGPSAPVDQKVSISIFDVTNPEQSVESLALELDGVLLATRRIGDNLYIISAYTPSLANLSIGASTDAAKLSNFKAITQTPIAQLMPQRYQDGQQSPLNNPEDCYIPAQATEQDGYAQFLNVTRVNLASPTQLQSVCLMAIADTLYMSTSTLYLAANVNNQDSLFHKIDLQTLDYAASGSVQGQLGWRGNPLFRMHENSGLLRVVTSDYSQSEPVHRLSVLEQQGNSLSAIATLPNAQAPELIGKPGEDIYAVRFIDDKAYIVTFQNIDPLYVINLSDNTNPYIEGELEIPGFSSYIHPLDNGYLIGIGQQVTLNQLPQIGFAPPMPPQLSGMKISLFDVRDPANPLELTSLVTPNAYTPVEFDYKTLSVLNTNGQYQFALPVERWGDVGTDLSPAGYNSLMMLETDTTANMPQLSLINNFTLPENTEFYFYTGDDRSIIQGNKVYYLRGNSIWLSEWAQGATSLGPY
jgi:uncharacterized secreted protein with C-terminal beta-propeller domain